MDTKLAMLLHVECTFLETAQNVRIVSTVLATMHFAKFSDLFFGKMTEWMKCICVLFLAAVLIMLI